jgi:transposase
MSATIPGGARPTAEMLVAKRTSGKPRKGHRFLRTTFEQAAHAAARTKGTYLTARYRRLATQRGQRRALLAVAHSILGMAYDLRGRYKPHRAAGAAFFDRLQPADPARRLVKRLENLGYHGPRQRSFTHVKPSSRQTS